MSLEINGEVIEDDIIHDELNYVIKGLPHPPNEEEKSTLLETVKENLIYKTLLRQEAEKLNIIIPKEHIEKEYQIFFNTNAPTPQTSDEVEKIKTFITQKLKESALIEDICKDLLTPTTAHLEIFYQDNLEHYFVAKQYHYCYVGFSYEVHSLYQELYTLLQAIIAEYKNTRLGFENLAFIANHILAKKTFVIKPKPALILAETKTNLPELSQDGFSLMENLAKDSTPAISKTTDVHPSELLFNPLKGLSNQASSTATPASLAHLGFYVLLNLRKNFTQIFAEAKARVVKDLREEMEQIKIKSFLRRVMEKSTIKDISYL